MPSEPILSAISTSSDLYHSKRYNVEIDKYLTLIATLKGQEEFLLDSTGKIISSNLEAANVTGYEEYEVIGKNISIFYAPSDQDKALTDLKRAAQLNNTVVTGIRVKKRGITFWAKMKIQFLGAGHPSASFKVSIQDNTHRTISRIKMQSVRDEYLTIFNNPFIGTFKCKWADNRVIMCNQKILDITGHDSSNSLYFKNFFKCPVQYEQFSSILSKEGRVEGFKFLINDSKSSENNWGLMSAHLFDNQFVGGVVMDISEQYNQVVELERVNTELEDFTYHASHDLRAPLTTILGLANLGLKDTDDERSRSYFEMIKARVGQLDQLLKDLASVPQNTKSEVISDFSDFQLEINQIVDSMKGFYPRHKVEFKLVQTHDFRTDAFRMRAVLRNLFSNAYKFSHPESSNPSLKIYIKVCLTHAAIMIKDNGVGIEHLHKDKIFNMFFRGSSRNSGAGLGLYLTKAMLEKINGKVAIESTLNHGTTFLLVIPNRLYMSVNK